MIIKYLDPWGKPLNTNLVRNFSPWSFDSAPLFSALVGFVGLGCLV